MSNLQELMDSKRDAYRDFDDTMRDIANEINEIQIDLYRRLRDGEIGQEAHDILLIANQKASEVAAKAAKEKLNQAIIRINAEYIEKDSKNE